MNNKFEKKKNVFSLIASLCSLIATGFLLVFVVLAWYAKNSVASVNGVIGSTSAENGLELVSSRTYMLDENDVIIKENESLTGLLFNDVVYFEFQVKCNEEFTEDTIRNVTVLANSIEGGNFFTKIINEELEDTPSNREKIIYGGKQFNMCDCFTEELLNVSITNESVFDRANGFNGLFTDSNKIISPSTNVADEFIGPRYLERELTTNTNVLRHQMAIYTGWKPSEGMYISFKFAIQFTREKTISGDEGNKTISELVPVNELSRKPIRFNTILIL